jgi:uncharacterized membrane protein HdeD (DUF308 family)
MMTLVQSLHDYFAAEKSESLLFMAVGVIAIALSVFLWVTRSPYRAAVWPLALIALIQIVVGSTVYFRTDRQATELVAGLERDPASARAAELARI